MKFFSAAFILKKCFKFGTETAENNVVRQPGVASQQFTMSEDEGGTYSARYK